VGRGGDRLTKVQYDVQSLRAFITISIAMLVLGPVAVGTMWGPGSYSFGALSGANDVVVSEEDGMATEVVQLGRYCGNKDGSQGPTTGILSLGGNYGKQGVSEVPTSTALQLSGYYDNMANYENIAYGSVLFGSFGFGGSGGGCGCCG